MKGSPPATVADLTPEVVEAEIARISRLLGDYVSGLVGRVGGQAALLLRAGRHDSSPLALALEEIFAYAAGWRRRADPERMAERAREICELFWSPPAGRGEFVVPWASWLKTPIGLAVRATMVRAALEGDAPSVLSLSASDVRLVTGLSKSALERAVADGRLRGTRNGREMLFPLPEVRRFLARRERAPLRLVHSGSRRSSSADRTPSGG